MTKTVSKRSPTPARSAPELSNLRALPLEDALTRYVRYLRRLVATLGVPTKFHATVTWAYVLLLHEAMEGTPGASFDELLTAHPSIVDHPNSALRDHYDPAQLASDEARRHFVLPRRA